jgi:hypothetical protein
MTWLPEGFRHPERVDLPTGHHLRPIREADVDIDYVAVMSCRERLWARFGEAWGWPPADLSHEADRKDLARHEAEIAAHEAFNYAVLDEEETALLGCVYIDPPDERSRPDADAVVSWPSGRRRPPRTRSTRRSRTTSESTAPRTAAWTSSTRRAR